MDNYTTFANDTMPSSGNATLDLAAATTAPKGQSSEEVFSYVMEGIFLTLVCLFGVIGNFMSFVVMVRSSVRDSFSNQLRGLAVFDSLFLLLALLAMGLPNLWVWYHTSVLVPAINVLFGLINTFRVASVCVTVCVNIERLCAIVFPLKPCAWKRFLLPASVLVAVVYDLPKFFEFDVVVDSKGRDRVVTR